MKKFLYYIFGLWLIGIIVAFAYKLPLLNLLWANLPDIFLLCLILSASYSIGAQTFALIKLNFSSPIEAFPFSTALGLGILAYFTLILGLSGLLYKPIFYAILLIPTFLSYKKIRDLTHWLWNQGRATLAGWAVSSDYLSFILLFLICLSLGLCFAFCFSPPKFFDVLGYHLAIPNQYIIMGKITYIPHSALSNYPFLIQMLFTKALLLRGEILAKLLIFAFFPLALMAIYCFCRRFWSSTASLTAIAIASTIPAVMQMATLAMVDLPLACFLLLALFSLIYWIKGYSKKWLIASSFFCGLSLGIKYTSFFYSLALISFLLILFSLINRKGLKKTICALFILVAFAFIISSPWWIKNYLYTGNPFFPSFYKYLDGKNWSLPQEKQLKATTANRIIEPFHPLSLIKLPWLWTVESERFGPVGNSPGVILLLFIPLLFVYIKKEKLIIILLLYSFLYFVIWLFTFQQGRFSLAMLFCLAIIVGYCFREFLNHIRTPWRVLLGFLIILFIAVNLAIFIKAEIMIFDPIPYLAGLETREQYLSRTIPAYPTINYINRNLPAEAVILFIGETRSFYCKRRCICPSAHDTNPISLILKEAGTSFQVAQMLAQQGVTHILFNQKETARLGRDFPVAFNWRNEDKVKLTHFFNSHCEIIFQQEGIFLLSISQKKVEKHQIP